MESVGHCRRGPGDARGKLTRVHNRHSFCKRQVDLETLQAHIENLTYADAISEGIVCAFATDANLFAAAQHRFCDPEFLKVIRLTQLTIEYLLYVQTALDTDNNHLKDTVEQLNVSILNLNNQLNKQVRERDVREMIGDNYDCTRGQSKRKCEFLRKPQSCVTCEWRRKATLTVKNNNRRRN